MVPWMLQSQQCSTILLRSVEQLVKQYVSTHSRLHELVRHRSTERPDLRCRSLRIRNFDTPRVLPSQSSKVSGRLTKNHILAPIPVAQNL